MDKFDEMFGGSNVLDDEQKVKVETVYREFANLARNMDAVIPDGRSKSIVMTNLEQAKMWAVNGIVKRK